jgi:hypothetical protein
MVKAGSLLSQLLQQISRLEFRHLVTRHEAEHAAGGFASWIHNEKMENLYTILISRSINVCLTCARYSSENRNPVFSSASGCRIKSGMTENRTL